MEIIDMDFEGVNTHSQVEAIVRLGMVSKRNEKKELLKKISPAILWWTYNPYRQFYVRHTPRTGTGNAGIDERLHRVLRLLAMRGVSGNRAESLLDTLFYILSPGAAMIANKILAKDLGAGVNVKTINEVYPNLIPEFGVMLAEPVEWHNVTYPCYASPKLDGMRAIFKEGVFFTRKGKTIQGLADIQFELYNLFGDAEVDGELLDPSTTFQVSTGMARRLKGDKSGMRYYVFDLPNHKGPFYARYAFMQTRFLDIPEGELKHVELVPHRVARNEAEARQLYMSWRKAGFEGAMLKRVSHLYQKKRSDDWMKVKNVMSVDKQVTGVYRGEGKYRSMMGGVMIEHNGHTVRVGSGFSDADRGGDWLRWMGRMIEVQYQEETDDGNLRQPRFIKLRPDLEG